ncbi:hypothetical protein [Marispirochaeta sp.]|uniref:hypothetical protein n=1 Tax=Marispirochaeta sp. TaxID=2038653 RepID=UPI0029C773B0|nr:hypothetical protein [Marispirochaeta sp.]
MSNRSSHRNKTIDQRFAYHRYIESRDVEPTLDEKIHFQDSVRSGEELSEPTSKRKRKVPLKDKAADHISEHWFEWVIAIVAMIMGYFVYESKL